MSSCLNPTVFHQVLPNGPKFYSATFRNASGGACHQGAGTTSGSFALKICEGLEELHQKRFVSSADRPETVVIEAARLYFGDMTMYADAVRLSAMLSDFPREHHERLFVVFTELDQLRKTNEAQRSEITDFKHEVRKLTDEMSALNWRCHCRPSSPKSCAAILLINELRRL